MKLDLTSSSHVVPNSSRILRLWNVAPRSKRFNRIPAALVNSHNPMMVSTFLTLQYMKTSAGYVFATTAQCIARRIGIRSTNKTAIRQIIDAILDLKALGILEFDCDNLTPTTFFEAFMFNDLEATDRLGQGKRHYASVYAKDLRAFGKLISKPHPPKLYRFLNALTRIRASMHTGVEVMDPYMSSYAILKEDTLYEKCHLRRKEVMPMMDLFSEAGVLAWAKFDRPVSSARKPSKLIAIVNHDVNNEQRIRRAIRLSKPSAYSKIKITHSAY